VAQEPPLPPPPPTQFGTIVNAGTNPNNQTSLAVGISATQLTQCGNIWSVPNVALNTNTKVNGFVKTTGTFAANGGTVTGAIQPGIALDLHTVTDPVTFTVSFPAAGATITLPTGTTTSQSISPGSFGNVTVNSGGNLTLSAAGNYFFESLTVGAGGNLTINVTSGRVIIFVRNTASYQGTQVFTGPATPPPQGKFLLVVTGIQVIIMNNFGGIVIAPAAQLLFNAPAITMTGAFYGMSITTLPNQVFVHIGWDGTLPSPPVTHP
jgi:hypothetical protein